MPDLYKGKRNKNAISNSVFANKHEFLDSTQAPLPSPGLLLSLSLLYQDKRQVNKSVLKRSSTDVTKAKAMLIFFAV